MFVALPERDGFVDAGKALADSQRDLEREINRRQHVRTARTRADADVVLTVVDRGILTEENGGVIFIPLGRAVLAKPTARHWNALRAEIKAGAYSREITGRFDGLGDVWEECAEIVSKELDGWAVANKDRLIAQRARP